MKTTQTAQDISGSYKTPDGKAQIDFGITYRNGYAEFTASGHYDGSSGQCIDSIDKAYPEDAEVKRWARIHTSCHLKKVNSTVVDTVALYASRFPARSFYNDQAEHFLSSNGIKFRATLSDSKTAPWDVEGVNRHHYRVTLSREGWKPDRRKAWEKLDDSASYTTRRATDLSTAKNRLVFDFWGSIADAEKGIQTVRPYDVLACVSSDAYTPETFEDFCADYGHESDSIKALQTFRRCSAFAKRLKAFFTEAELEQLSEIQ